MKGSIIKKVGKRGTTYTIIYYVDKKQIWRGGFPTKKDAAAELAERISKINAGTWQELKPIGFKALADKWLDEYARLAVKPGTLRSYQSGVTTWLVPHFGERPVAGIRPADVQAFLAQATQATSARSKILSPKTANNVLVLLKEILGQGKRWGYLRDNPAAEIKPARVEHREMEFYTVEEVQLLLKNAEGLARALLMTAALTGMRRNELLALRWGDVDWRANQIRVRQQLFKLTRKEAGGEPVWRFTDLKSRYGRRAIDVAPELRDALEVHRLDAVRSPHDLIFCRPDGSPLDPETAVNQLFVATVKKAGLRVIRFHDLRHTYAALQVAAGASPKYLQAQMGHSSIKVTLDLYGHLMPDAEQQAARRLGALVFGGAVPTNNGLRGLAKTPAANVNQEKELVTVTPNH